MTLDPDFQGCGGSYMKLKGIIKAECVLQSLKALQLQGVCAWLLDGGPGQCLAPAQTHSKKGDHDRSPLGSF